MGRMKDLYMQQEANAHVHPVLRQMVNIMSGVMKDDLRPVVHVLLCDGAVIDVYSDEGQAQYELHLCKQADKYYGDNEHQYMLVSKPVNVNQL